MKIKKIIVVLPFFITQLLNAETLPLDFYMKESYKKFVKSDMGDSYYIEKRVNNNFIAVSEEYNKKNRKLINKSESVFINPVKVTSYNDYYQINKNYFYENGKINKTSYEIGKIDNCFVKCGRCRRCIII